MKKIVPFKKDIIFKTNLSEIVSISLEHSLHLEKQSLITGEFIISGEYKMADTSLDTEKFSFNLPFDINIDDRYILDNMTVDIEDFYYEIVNNNVLSVNIEVLIDKIEEKPKVIEAEEVIENRNENIEEVENKTENIEKITESRNEVIEDIVETRIDNDELKPNPNIVKKEVIEDKEPKIEKAINNIFDNLTEFETYTTYQVYIIRENDTIETVLNKYNITRETLNLYNDLTELKLGDKLIIPQVND